MINDEVQRLRNPKNTKIEMRERERLPQNSIREKQKSRERERGVWVFLSRRLWSKCQSRVTVYSFSDLAPVYIWRGLSVPQALSFDSMLRANYRNTSRTGLSLSRPSICTVVISISKYYIKFVSFI